MAKATNSTMNNCAKNYNKPNENRINRQLTGGHVLEVLLDSQVRGLVVIVRGA